MASAACPTCRRRVKITTPAGGDGSVDVFDRHKRYDDGPVHQCPSSRQVVDLDESANDRGDAHA